VTQVLILVAVVFFVRVLKQARVLDRFLSPSASQTYAPIVGGVLAWSILGLVGWGCWQIVMLVLAILSVQFDFIDVIKLAAIAMGLAYLYQIIVTYSEAGATGRMWNLLLRSLLFQSQSRVRDDIFEKAERLKLQQRIERELEDQREHDVQKPKDEDLERYFDE
jgi:hypothetical protein